MVQIIKNIVEIRNKLGYSQEYMADMIGITQTRYSRFERDKDTKLDYKIIEKIAKDVFKMKVEDVLNYHEKTYSIPKKASEEINDPENKYVTFSTLDLILNSKNETIQALKKALTDKEELIKMLKSKLSKS